MDYLDAEIAGSVTEQVLEVLIASRFPEGGAGEQVLDPGAAQVEGKQGVQLVPRPGRVRLPVGRLTRANSAANCPNKAAPAKANGVPRASRAT